ncbi:hypothetical protein ACNF42_02280 [Cuniculiplasma sp. SKW3]|uniref:hypothetical protein n=1 Tax=Cuniculiplasma sp. SKW3 TaxID=3400170 RepID=UPI003FD0E1E8
MVISVITGTIIIALLSLMDFIIEGKGIVRREALYNFPLGINGVYGNVVLSGLIFTIILIMFLVYFIGENKNRDANEDKGNVSELFFFIFLWISAISSITPPVKHITDIFGILGLTTYYEESALYFSIIILLSALISFIALNLQIGVELKSAIIRGHRYKTLYYLFSIVPALISTGLFLIQNQVTLIYAAILFLLFLSVMLFIQRYGFVRGMASVFIIFGSEIIPNYFRIITVPLYDLFIFAFLTLGFISLIYPYKSSIKKSKSQSEGKIENNNSNETKDEGSGNSVFNSEAHKNSLETRSKDSREMADDLFIRGTCLYCDSVEFYYNSDGTLTCKKCKAILTGKETNFNSFNVMKGGRRL